MTRVLIKTDKRGWYADARDPEGKKVRKQEADQIFDNLLEAQEAMKVLEKVHGKPSGSNGAKRNGKAETERKPTETKILSSGKIATGNTVTIKCQWKGEDGKSKMCGKEREIKPQDQFQVRFCVEHQEVHRRMRRNAAARARAEQRREAKAKTQKGGKATTKRR